jgi:endonuclease/exonuclease/phosphatase (EEP) superfamily protein YafD
VSPIRIILWSLAGLVAALTALGFGDRLGLDGRAGWVFDLLSHWPRHLLVAGIVIGAIALWRRAKEAALTAFAAAAVNAILLIGPGGSVQPREAPAGAAMIRVASANVHRSLPALEKLATLARDYGADIVAVYEAPEALADADVVRLFPDYPVHLLPSQASDGSRLIRRSLLTARRGGEIDLTTFPGSHGVILRTMHGNVQIVTTHPPSPGDPGLKRDRDVQLAALGDDLDQAQPFVIVGDFNTTPWGRAYASVPGMRAGDPRFEGTFPAFAGPLGLPIDHVKFGGGLVLTDYRTGPDIGSDHLPLFAAFALPSD